MYNITYKPHCSLFSGLSIYNSIKRLYFGWILLSVLAEKYFVGLCKKLGGVCVFLAKTKGFFDFKSIDKKI